MDSIIPPENEVPLSSELDASESNSSQYDSVTYMEYVVYADVNAETSIDDMEKQILSLLSAFFSAIASLVILIKYCFQLSYPSMGQD